MTPNLTHIEDLIPEVKVVATIEQDIATISKLNNLELQESYDDLDFLVFAILPLYSNIRVALVSYQNTPVPSIEICVRHDLQNVSMEIAKTLDNLHLTPEDLTWINPQYEIDKYWCRVIASLTRDTIDIDFLGRGELGRIPFETLPTDLRFPNAELWLGWDSTGKIYYFYRNKSDSVPAGIGREVSSQ
jgi:hypothetical protein